MITALLCLLLAGILAYQFLIKKLPPALYVLAYQKIGTPPTNSRLKNQWTSPTQLEKDFQFLTRHHFTALPPQDLGRPLPKPVLLAFIGGYQSFFTHVFPLLKKYRLKACVFLTPDTIGQYNRWQDPHQEAWQNILTAQQVEILRQSPLISFGTTGLTQTGTLMLGQNELEESIARFERFYQIPVRAAATAEKTNKNLNTPLPVLLTETGANALNETRYLRLLKPTVWARFILWRHR